MNETIEQFKARVSLLTKSEINEMRREFYELLEPAFKMRKALGKEVYEAILARYIVLVDLSI